MTTPKKTSKKETRTFIQSKAYFTSPFSTQWSPLPQEDMHFILKTVKDKLISTGIQKKEFKPFRRWRNHEANNPTYEGYDDLKNGWTDLSVRRQLAIGINEVTKALERDELKLLLVCKSVKPKHMTEHLITLSASRGVAACQVPRLSLTVSQPLGLRSVLALGFKGGPEGHQQLFADIIDVITPRVPSLNVAWLQSAASVKMEDSVEEDGVKKGHKRKLKSEAEQEPTASCVLQPLKVKRIVPNPAKKVIKETEGKKSL